MLRVEVCGRSVGVGYNLIGRVSVDSLLVVLLMIALYALTSGAGHAICGVQGGRARLSNI